MPGCIGGVTGRSTSTTGSGSGVLVFLAFPLAAFELATAGGYGERYGRKRVEKGGWKKTSWIIYNGTKVLSHKDNDNRPLFSL